MVVPHVVHRPADRPRPQQVIGASPIRASTSRATLPSHTGQAAGSYDATIWVRTRFRIASSEMFPWADLLPHVTCSPPVLAGGGGERMVLGTSILCWMSAALARQCCRLICTALPRSRRCQEDHPVGKSHDRTRRCRVRAYGRTAGRSHRAAIPALRTFSDWDDPAPGSWRRTWWRIAGRRRRAATSSNCQAARGRSGHGGPAIG